MAPTQKEIARRLGVSQGLVSQILNGKWPARSKLHRHILRESERLGYLPNHAASALRTGRRNTWGIVLPSFVWLGDFNHQIIRGISEVAHENRRLLSITAMEVSNQSQTQEYMLPIRQGRFDGVFLFYDGDARTPLPLDEIHGLGVATIIVNCPLPDERTHYVCSDAEVGIYQAVRHLIEVHGRRRIAYLWRDKDSWLIEERYRGFLRAHRDLGLAVDPRLVRTMKECGSYEKNAEHQVHSLVHDKIAFDAVVTPMDFLSIPAIGVLADHGLRVPCDVAVVGFDDYHLCQGIRPQLTTVHCDGVAMGRRAGEIMLDVLEDKTNPAIRKHREPATLVVRESCGCKLVKQSEKGDAL